MRTALIAGASGLVGSSLLKLLLADEEYQKIISIGRRTLDIEHPKLEQHVISFEKLDDLKITIDAVFCCLGTTIKKAGSKDAFRKVDFEFPLLLEQFASKNGAKSFHIITAMGADSKSSVFYNSVKGEIEDELTSSTIDQVEIYRPSLLLGDRGESRIMEALGQKFMKAASFLFVGGLKNYKAIPVENVANFMLKQSLIARKGISVHLSGKMQ